MKKIISVVLMAVLLLSGCGSMSAEPETTAETKPPFDLAQYKQDVAACTERISSEAIVVYNVAKKERDYMETFENISGKYEFIVSNPPYIPTGVIPTLMEEVRDHEPVSALDGREDGLYFYREIVEKAGEYLYPGGMLFFEIGYDQAEKVSSLMREAGYQEVTVCKDLAGLDRVVYGTLL